VTCNNWGYDETVFLGDGLGAFHTAGPPTEVDGDGEPLRLLLRDFNNDGRFDIFVNAPDDFSALIYLGDGKGNFPGPAEEVEDLPHPAGGMDAGDLNGDGNLDVVATCPAPRGSSGADQVSILLGDGTGGFSLSTFSLDRPPFSVKVGDLNNDGKLDLVVAGAPPNNSTGNFISTYLGDGAGGFTLKQDTDLGTGNLKGEIAIGDFNEDGKLDVAFPQTGAQIQHEPSTTVLIFFGDGTGNLTAGPTLTVGQEPHTAIATDVNHDGHLDLAVSNRTDGTVTVLLGDGRGNFTVSSTTSVLSSTP
jgi:hypothetical protein